MLIGELILLFGNVEWLIANVIFLSEIPKNEFDKIKEMPITQRYFEVLLELNFHKKLEALKETGFDITRIKKVSNYRNILSHGLIFREGDSLSIVKLSKPKVKKEELNKIKITEDIEILKEEGGKLLEFIKAKGYNYHSPIIN